MQNNIDDFDVSYQDDGLEDMYDCDYAARYSAQFEVDLLNVSPSVIKKLHEAGYQSFEDFKGQNAISLSKECNISQKDSLLVLKQVKGGVNALRSSTNNNNTNIPPNTSVKTQSAFEAFQKHKDRRSIITFCKEVDDLLSGGIPMGQTSEICGVPGAGKTQLALQLAVNVQLPQIMDGCEGECLYIDTEGSFMTERLEQIASSFVKHIHRMAAQSTSDSGLDEKRKVAAEKITVESVLRGIQYFRLYNLLEQLAFVHILEEYVKQNNIKLIIFDSVTFHFRHDQAGFSDHFQRNRLLQGMGQKLSQIAYNHDIAVVYLNQVTTKVDKNDPNNSHLAPALGMTWSNACNNHFFLEFDRGERYFRVNKSLNTEPSRAKYTITSDGFRGVNRRLITYEEQQLQENMNGDTQETRKRPREQ